MSPPTGQQALELTLAALRELARSDPPHFWIATAIMAGTAVGAFVYGFSQLRRARLMEDMPTSRLRSAAQGYVELQGHARLLPGPDIVSPLSDTRCCWWEFRVERRRTVNDGGRRRSEWVLVEHARSSELFLLDDGTGQCVVDPEGATVIPSLWRRWYGYHPRPRSVPKKSPWFSAGDHRYTEQLVQYGDPLYALGAFQSQSAVRADDESGDVADLLARWKREPRELLQRFDADRDGQIDLKEWEAARREAQRIVRSDQVERSVAPDLHVLSAPVERRPFILSARAEGELTRRFRWVSVGSILLSLLAGAGTLLALIAYGLV